MAYGAGIWVKQDGKWKEVTVPQARTNGQWKTVIGSWIKQDGSWQRFFPSTSETSFRSPGVTSFTVPPGVYKITANVVGGGGGGGASSVQGNGAAGGGGGSGGYVAVDIVTTPGEKIAITVGAGGTGSTVADVGQAGGDGTSSSLSSAQTSVIATGGKGGKSGHVVASYSSGQTASGDIGSLLNNIVDGFFDFNTTDSLTVRSFPGAGGAAGAPGGNQGGSVADSAPLLGGPGAASLFGPGAPRAPNGAVDSSGVNAVNPGSGGSGASALNSTGVSYPGGRGAPGVITLKW
jgi:trimeric autotransporter adhesin